MSHESSVADFTMQIRQILGPESDVGALVIGPLFGTPPNHNDLTELVTLYDTKEVRVETCKETALGYTVGLRDINKDSIKKGYILQSPGRVTKSHRSIIIPKQQLFSPDAHLFGSLDQEIVNKGEGAVPVVIECFLNPGAPNPILPYHHGIADQGVLASALEMFAAKGNQEAASFLQEVVDGKIPVLKNTRGEIGHSIAERFVMLKEKGLSKLADLPLEERIKKWREMRREEGN